MSAQRLRLSVTAVAAAVCGAMLGGCAVGPNYHTPAMKLPGGYVAGPSPVTNATAVPDTDLDGWWRTLGDPELNSLIERAVRANPDIEIALERLQAARAYELGTLSPLLPQVDATGGAGKGTGSDLGRGRAAQPLVSSDRTSGLTQINALGGFDAVWELDLFGMYRREIEAARADAQAAAAARSQVLLVVISDVARAYIELRGFQARSATLSAAINVVQQSLDIVTQRYQRGITNELDLTLAQRESETLKAQLQPLQAQTDAARDTLAALLGTYPESLAQELAPQAMLPALPDSPALGAPLELLRRRPDIRQAERELAAATARIGVAEGALFPQVALTAGAGVQHQGGLGSALPSVSQNIWSVGPAALWPLLDFGALDAQVQVADYRTRAQLAVYRRSIERAVQEVDTAASAYAAQRASLASLQTAMVAAARAVTLAQQRYDMGITDYLNVVDAQRQQYLLEDQYAQAQAEGLTQLVALYRALGGGWQGYQDVPPVTRPLPAVMAMFRDVLTVKAPPRTPDTPVPPP